MDSVVNFSLSHAFMKQPLLMFCLSFNKTSFVSFSISQKCIAWWWWSSKRGLIWSAAPAVLQAPLLILHLLMLLLGVISQKTDISAALRWADDRCSYNQPTGKLLNLSVSSLQPFHLWWNTVISRLCHISVCNIINTNCLQCVTFGPLTLKKYKTACFTEEDCVLLPLCSSAWINEIGGTSGYRTSYQSSWINILFLFVCFGFKTGDS